MADEIDLANAEANSISIINHSVNWPSTSRGHLQRYAGNRPHVISGRQVDVVVPAGATSGPVVLFQSW